MRDGRLSCLVRKEKTQLNSSMTLTHASVEIQPVVVVSIGLRHGGGELPISLYRPTNKSAQHRHGGEHDTVPTIIEPAIDGGQHCRTYPTLFTKHPKPGPVWREKTKYALCAEAGEEGVVIDREVWIASLNVGAVVQQEINVLKHIISPDVEPNQGP